MQDEVSRIIGRTPLVKLEGFSAQVGAEVFVKYEAANPGASIKDRAALCMIDRAEERGTISPGATLIEPTSGNTGIGIAMIGAARGYRVILVMPESMSRERRALAAAYGAQVVLTPADQGMAGSVREAERLASEIGGSWIVGQFTNPDNPLAHELGTAPEIEEQLGCGNPMALFEAGNAFAHSVEILMDEAMPRTREDDVPFVESKPRKRRWGRRRK